MLSLSPTALVTDTGRWHTIARETERQSHVWVQVRYLVKEEPQSAGDGLRSHMETTGWPLEEVAAAPYLMLLHTRVGAGPWYVPTRL